LERNSPTTTGPESRGFTLLEVLLVLVVLIVLLTLAIPVMRGPLQTRRLRADANDIRVAWSKARVEAMRTGQLHLFRFKTGAREYSTEIWQDEGSILESGETGVEPLRANSRAVEQAEVSEDGYFVRADYTDDLVSSRTEQRLEMSPDGAQLSVAVNADAEWSRPILFHPDGTTSTVHLVLANKRGLSVAVDLRGLTGSVRVGEMQSLEEDDQ